MTPSYLDATLGDKEQSVKNNGGYLPSKQYGLVDQDGATTDRAKLWRDDKSYSDVCKEIRDELYPADLLNAILDPSIEKDAAQRWFMTETACGADAARKMAGMYSLLAEADPSSEDQVTAPKPKNRASTESKKPTETVSPKRRESADRQERGLRGASILGPDMPEMRLNVEIRIDASVTPEQIDLIFSSMAKHLYGRDDEER